jgi:hypothetical protein
MRTHSPSRTPRLLLAAGLASLSLLAGCSGGGETSSGESGAGGSDARVEGPSPMTAREEGLADTGKEPARDGAVDPAAAQLPGERMARSATLVLRVRDLGQAAASVRSISAATDGVVVRENIGGGGDLVPLREPSRVSATTYGELTISVPSAQLDRVLTDLSRLGTVVRRETSAQNVTAEYVDTESRIRTMQASVERVRALMTKATEIAQVVTLETELSRRQADLEALQARMEALRASVERAPVHVSLTTDPAIIATGPGSGFLGGLEAGWRAFTASLVALATVIGAVLPFAVTAAAVGVPLWWVVRRRRAAALSAPSARGPAQ